MPLAEDDFITGEVKAEEDIFSNYSFLVSLKILLAEAFYQLPERCKEVTLFREAYSHRHLFDYLAESGSDEDPSGLVAAVSSALASPISFKRFKVEGAELYPKSYPRTDLKNKNETEVRDSSDTLTDYSKFKEDLYEAAAKLPVSVIYHFFRGLEIGYVNYELGNLENKVLDEKDKSVNKILTEKEKRSLFLDQVKRYLREIGLKPYLIHYAETATFGAPLQEIENVEPPSGPESKEDSETEPQEVNTESSGNITKTSF